MTPPGLDPTFGHHRVVLADLGGSSPEMGAARITAPGGSTIVRYTARGLLDRSFGTDGRIDFPLAATPLLLVLLPGAAAPSPGSGGLSPGSNPV